jgi:hypothetical protein
MFVIVAGQSAIVGAGDGEEVRTPLAGVLSLLPELGFVAMGVTQAERMPAIRMSTSGRKPLELNRLSVVTRAGTIPARALRYLGR